MAKTILINYTDTMETLEANTATELDKMIADFHREHNPMLYTTWLIRRWEENGKHFAKMGWRYSD